MKRLFASAVLVVLSLAAVAPAAPAVETTVKVVANTSMAGSQIKKEALVAAFLGQAKTWADGKPILAVDQSTRSAVRAAFSQSLLSQSVFAVQAYWMDQITSGRGRPPLTKASDAEVIAYVQANPGSIGYVSADTEIEAGVKVVQVVQ